MAHTTFIRSWPAIGLGVFFGGVTGFVLFEDVLHGAAINTGHVQTAAALVGAIAAGHMAWPAIKSRETIIQGLMLAVLSVGALAYVCVTSGARNAETSGNKAATITTSNEARKAEELALKEARVMLAEQQARAARECSTGRGKLCIGAEASVSVYQRAVDGANARLDKMPAPKVNGYAHAAKVLASWGVAVTDEWLSLNMPFLVVLISELGCVAFLHLGLGHRPAPKPVEPDFKDEDLAPLPAERDHVLDFCKAFKAANGRKPRIKEVQSKFPDCPHTTAWRRSNAA